MKVILTLSAHSNVPLTSGEIEKALSTTEDVFIASLK